MRLRTAELGKQLGDPKVTSDIPMLKTLTREFRAATNALEQLKEYERLEKEAQEAEARSAEAIIKLIKTKDMYTRKLEALRDCDCGR